MNKSHQEIIETQVDVAELAIGMHVTRLDRPWEETDFLIPNAHLTTLLFATYGTREHLDLTRQNPLTRGILTEE